MKKMVSREIRDIYLANLIVDQSLFTIFITFLKTLPCFKIRTVHTSYRIGMLWYI